MNRVLLLYLVGLVLRSLMLGVMASILLVKVRRAELRHAVWTAILLLIVLMPIADTVLPRAFVPTPVPEIIAPIQTFILAPQATAQPVIVSVPSEAAPRRMDWWQISTMLMGIITIVFFTRFVFMLRQVRWIRRGSRPIENALWEEWRQRDGRDAILAVSDLVRVPLTIGWWNPLVILPSGWDCWEDSRLRHVLVHEWTHVCRRDWAIASFAAFVKCVFWFNPLIWWIERQLSSLAEQSSDEASVRFSEDPLGYAETLLQFAAVARQGDRWMGGVTMAQHKISQRIERILALQRPGHGVLSRTAWIALVAASLPVLYLSAASQATSLELPRVSMLPMVQAPQTPAPVQSTVNPPTVRIPAPAPAAAPQDPIGPAAPAPTANPDLVGEIKLILMPVDSRGVPGQVQIQTRDGTNRFSGTAVWNVQNSALDANTWLNNNAFSFVLTGIQNRALQFEGLTSGSFSYGCADCAFVVWESGVGLPAASQSPGIVFQLSPDGKTLTATCRATECLAMGRGDLVRRIAPVPNGVNPSVLTDTARQGIWRYWEGWNPLAPMQASRIRNSETWTFPVLRDTTGTRTCFSVSGTVKADGTPFTDADCGSGASVGPATTMTFSVKR